MKKYIGILIIPLIFSCTSGSPSSNSSRVPQGLAARHFLDTSPYNNELIFLGVAGIRSDKDESIKFALEDAARKVAFYHTVGGSIVHRVSIGEGFLDYSSEHEASIDFEADYVRYVDELHYDPETDVFIDKQAVFVRTRYTPQGAPKITHVFSPRDKKPQWIDNPPEKIAGFVVGVGYAMPRLYHKDTVIASYENAVYTIIRNASSTVEASIESKQGSERRGGSSANSTNSVVSASGRLRGFYVLEMWIDPANQAVWTLAIAQEFF
jgi:hypothetical protein